MRNHLEAHFPVSAVLFRARGSGLLFWLSVLASAVTRGGIGGDWEGSAENADS